MKKNRLKKLTLSALFAAVICIISPFSVQLGSVPISLATFSVYLAALLLPMTLSLTAITGYVVLGAVGLPVFAGFLGGLSRIIAPSGGFIIGYIPCVLIVSAAARFADSQNPNRLVRFVLYAFSAFAGAVVCYLIGTVQFCLITGSSLTSSVAICVFPFVPFEIIKIIASAYLASFLKKRSFYLL